MSDDQDQSQKTEEPSEKKLEDAHKRGEVVKSREVSHWFMLLAIAIAVGVSAEPATQKLQSAFVGIFSNAHAITMEKGRLMDLYQWILVALASALAVPILMLMFGALAGSVLQHRPSISGEKLKPNLSKLSPVSGFKKLFGAQNFVEFLKTVLKFVIVAAVVAVIVAPELSRLDTAMTWDLASILPYVKYITLKMIGGVLAIMTIMAAADYFFQYMQHRKKLKMTKQEMKDEFKQTDGDPHIKARLRQIRMERSRTRMMAAVPEATVIITNPTHYSVAMKYDLDTMDAPKVVAKGVDHLAFRIRELAKEHKIPIVENPPLARALYAAVDVDREVPPEHYKAVAEVISFVMGLRRKALGSR